MVTIIIIITKGQSFHYWSLDKLTLIVNLIENIFRFSLDFYISILYFI